MTSWSAVDCILRFRQAKCHRPTPHSWGRTKGTQPSTLWTLTPVQFHPLNNSSNGSPLLSSPPPPTKHSLCPHHNASPLTLTTNLCQVHPNPIMSDSNNQNKGEEQSFTIQLVHRSPFIVALHSISDCILH